MNWMDECEPPPYMPGGEIDRLREERDLWKSRAERAIEERDSVPGSDRFCNSPRASSHITCMPWTECHHNTFRCRACNQQIDWEYLNDEIYLEDEEEWTVCIDCETWRPCASVVGCEGEADSHGFWTWVVRSQHVSFPAARLQCYVDQNPNPCGGSHG